MPSPRKICFSTFDSPGNPWYGGGGAQAVHEVARRLAGRGHTVTVVSGRFPGARDETRDGVHYERRGWSAAGPQLGQLGFQLGLPARARRGDFDLWVESLTPPFSTACLQKFTARPVVALTQVLAGQAMTRKYGLPFASIERAGLKTYRFAIATSEYLAAEIRRRSPAAQVVVIPNGVPPEYTAHDPGPPTDEHVLFLGRIAAHQKGIDLLLNALVAVRQRFAVPLVVAGAGQPHEEAWLRERLSALGLEPQVRWVGPVTGVAKTDLLRRAMFLALPSRFEAWPLVAVEAFSHRLPVVMFALPELSELPDTCTLKVPVEDAAALGEAMIRLAGDAAGRRQMGDAARAYACGLDWDTLARRYEDFFESVLQTG